MGNVSTEVSLESHSEMVKEGVDHRPVVIFAKENMDSYKPVTVVNISHVRFIGGPTSQVIIGNKQVVWDPEISVAVITTVGVPVEEAFSGIGMNSRKVVFRMECNVKSSWLRSIG